MSRDVGAHSRIDRHWRIQWGGLPVYWRDWKSFVTLESLLCFKSISLTVISLSAFFSNSFWKDVWCRRASLTDLHVSRIVAISQQEPKTFKELFWEKKTTAVHFFRTKVVTLLLIVLFLCAPFCFLWGFSYFFSLPQLLITFCLSIIRKLYRAFNDIKNTFVLSKLFLRYFYREL